jgi:hypothetical protein
LAYSNTNKVVGFETAGNLLKRHHPELLVSKQKHRQAEAIQLVRLNREVANPNLGFASRPFVLCGLPIKRPAEGALMHERRNGQFVLQVIGHPNYGVPWGQDRLVPIFLATLAMRQQKQTITFRSAAEMLDVLACSKAARSIGDWSPPFSGCLVQLFFSARIRSRRRRPFHIKRDSTSCVKLGSGTRTIPISSYLSAGSKT